MHSIALSHISASLFAAQNKKLKLLSREFYQKRGLFCIEVTWSSGNPNSVYLNLTVTNGNNNFTKNCTKNLNFLNNKTLIKCNLEAGAYTVKLETFELCEIISIKNCSNERNKKLIGSRNRN